MENVENILERLYSFYQVTGASELSEKIDVTQQTISNWKKRNSISAVKKRCRELGVYDEIFDEKEKIYDEMNLKFNISQKRKILKEQCKKYDIQVTNIENKRLLYLFEQISSLGYKRLEEVEKDLKSIILKLVEDKPLLTRINKSEFLEILEKNIKEFEKENL